MMQSQNSESVSRRGTKGTAAASRESHDWYHSQDNVFVDVSNDMQKLSLEASHQQESPHDKRKGRCGGQGHRASKTTASIFDPPTPRDEPPLHPELRQKVEAQKPLTSEERHAALYHPNLFRQPMTSHPLNEEKPWNIGNQELPFRASRKMHTATPPATAAMPSDVEEIFYEFGKKKHGQDAPHLDGTLQPAQPNFVPSRKHVVPVINETEQRKLVKKHVEMPHQASINLKIEEYPTNVSPPKERFFKKRVEVAHGDTINLSAAAEQVHDASIVPGKKFMSRPAASDSVTRTGHKRGPTQHSSAQDPKRCPFGTELCYDVHKTKQTGMARPSNESSGVSQRTTGLAMPSNRPKDQTNLLSWQ